MIDEELKKQILKSISLTGSVNPDTAVINPIIAGSNNLAMIIDSSSGKPRIHSSRSKQFTLALSQPNSLAQLNPFEIRCCLCHKVISYPAWYYSIKYAVNHFHYFICFDKD